ncbi:MAG TPA: NFACT family protein [Bacillota bacterium]|nr:NFACT family protein [Bacillota bacterium]
MSLDGRFLSLLAQELDEKLKTGRLQKISQLGKTDFLFFIRAQNQNLKLYISLSTSLARINLTKANYPSDYTPGGFCMFLRKYLEGSLIQEIKTLNDDRILQMECEGTNEIGDKVKLYLILEIFSRYTNLIVLDESRHVINAYNHISPFDNADRTIINGIEYQLPEDHKIAPRDFPSIKEYLSVERTEKEMVEQIRGISPLFARYVLKSANYNHVHVFDRYKEAIDADINPTMYMGEKTDFYHFDVFGKSQKHFSSLSSLLDDYYLEASSIERVKQIHKYLNTFTKQELKRKKNKLEKLAKDLENALNNDLWRIKGDILITDQGLIKRGDSSYSGHSYELDQDIEIELDQLLNPVQNANKYYTKYKKQKTAVGYIEEQIEITKNQIVYLDSLIDQIANTHILGDLIEIQDELTEQGFLPRKRVSPKKGRPNYEIFVDASGIQILVGKNNIQNNYLTHKFAHKDYWWFHVQGQTGSHTIVCTKENLQESTIRLAANLSAYYSRSRLSGSVPVDYTRVRNLKKVPGNLGSFVTYTNQKTIYIDPDPMTIETLSRKNK